MTFKKGKMEAIDSKPISRRMMLNPSQKRFLMATLGEVEDKLRRLKGLLQDHKEEGLFSCMKDDISQEEKNLLNEKIDYLIVSLVHLKKRFDLGESKFVLRYITKATSVYLSIQLEGTMSNRLKAYGEITKGLKESLDPALNDMKSVLRQMESIV
jgi:hypothetical protein